ncbi:MAG TPA: hypothetical protein VHG51_18205 [Longimicrobiaceae bacterium]|nr:hypothetical protein [Longimicrobiaceae bacterium]
MSDNSHEHKTVAKDGYEVTFHPAFASRCVVRGNGEGAEPKELYKLEGKHVFKNGAKHPKRHTIRLKGGEHNRDLELVINDPKHHVARIVVEMYPEDHEPGWGASTLSVETFESENGVATCPPDCDNGGGGDNTLP